MSKSTENNPNTDGTGIRPSLPADYPGDVARPIAPARTSNSIILEEQAEPEAGETTALRDPDFAGLIDNQPATIAVRDYLDQRAITVKFDASFESHMDLKDAAAVGQTGIFLRQIERTYATILEDLVAIFGPALKKPALKLALNRELRVRQQERYASVLEKIMAVAAAGELANAQDAWDKVSTLFETAPDLTTGVMKHFIWQVKRKVLGLAVAEHLMPIVFSERQGTGKTTFAQKFLAPIAELASDPVALADVADIRSGDIFRYPVILIDDIDAVTAKDTHLLKTIMSSRKIRRRILQTSSSAAYRQNATFFGTSNKDIADIVPDETGHRRFAMLPFRDGIETPELRETINNEIDYELLWRSVDPRQASPITACMTALRQHQGLFREDGIAKWLFNLDIESEEVKRVITHYGVQARDLYDLLCAQTKIEVSEKAFSSRMRFLIREDESPFDCKRRRRDAYYYQLRKS